MVKLNNKLVIEKMKLNRSDLNNSKSKDDDTEIIKLNSCTNYDCILNNLKLQNKPTYNFNINNLTLDLVSSTNFNLCERFSTNTKKI
jgi:hypothetical protein